MDRGKRSEAAELLMVTIFAFLLKLFAGRNSLTEMGIVLPGYDEYYHMRRILYTVNHFPDTLWFDSYLNYPHGLNITWPPLFDQLSALLSIVLGQHSPQGVEKVSIYVPILMGALAVVVVYYLVRDLFDSRVAILAAVMTSLAPYYLLYTMLGATDHHCLEVLLFICTLLFLARALCEGKRWHNFAALAGVMMAALAYTWQGAALYLGIFLVYAAVQMTLDLKRGASSREAIGAILTAFGVAVILVLPFWNSSWLSTSFLGLVVMIVALLVMFALSKLMAERKVPWTAFPLSIVGLVLVFAFLTQLTGGLFGAGSMMQSGVAYIWGGEMIGKVGEAEPLIYNSETFFEVIFTNLGFNLLLSLAGIAALAIHIRRSNDENGGQGAKSQGQLLLLIWAASTILLTIGQARFLYLSTIAMGVLISILFFQILEQVGRRMAERDRKLPAGLVAVLLLLVLILPTAVDTLHFALNTPPAAAGDWSESLGWLKENSNTTSYYDDPVKTAEYSVMSWWDYGNWILLLAKRPVVANNFQAGLEDSARFYLSENEEAAAALLDARGSKYVLADYDLIYGKLAALTTWGNEDIHSYIKLESYGSSIAAVPLPRLFNTTLARLYFYDGAGMSHFRLIHESSTLLGENPAKSKVKTFEYVPGALIRVKAGADQKVGALLNMTSNQGRRFIYVNEGSRTGDVFEIRVPYSTESRYGTHATTSYLVFSGNKMGIMTQNVIVSEKDVLAGRTIEVSF